jgi:murein DD-endopeptidase MepM/ murein hydrolase activator NlpD
MVEIDHGFGIVTRYGHMGKVLVSRGDEIGFRDKIGLMGQSGRSTGTHVHYEVLFNGIPQNPAKFLKAGQHVFKN